MTCRCQSCGNEKCAADKCTLESIRIMLECGDFRKCFERIRENDHFEPRKNSPDEQELELLKAQADAEREREFDDELRRAEAIEKGVDR